MIFIKSKYTNWYNSIVEKAKIRHEENGYYEKHHIIPKSLGGSNDKDNIVRLTAKEHFICHCLLVRMTIGKNKRKMLFALKCLRMSNKRQQRYTSRLYDKHKPLIAEAYRNEYKGKPNGRKGSKFSDEVKLNMSLGSKKSSIKKEKAIENFKKASLANKGKTRPEHLKKQWSDKRKGVKFSNNTKVAMSLSAKERTKIRCSCRKCGKELPVNSIYSHWRFCN